MNARGWAARACVVLFLVACGARSELDVEAGAADAALGQDADDGGQGIAEVSPQALDFGTVDCGTAGSPQIVTVANVGTAAFAVWATLTLGASSPYDVSPSWNIVDPGGAVQFVVSPKTVPPNANLAPDAYDDTLTLTTNVTNDSPHVVSLKQSATGAIVEADATTLSFADTAVGSSSALPLTFTNKGSVAAILSLSTSAPFVAPASVTMPAGGSATITVSYVPGPTALGIPTSRALVTSGVPLCAAPSITLTGRSFDHAVSLALGGQHSCAAASSGYLYCWGDNASGQLGDGTTQTRLTPAAANVTGFTSVGAGFDSTCATMSGASKCWGGGTLGNGTTSSSKVPVTVTGLTDATRLFGVGGGVGGFCAIRSGGGAACWGAESDGRFGNGNWNFTLYTTPVSAFVGISDIVWFAGSDPICALRANGSVECAGSGAYGALGNGATGGVWDVPVAVQSITTAIGLASTGGSSSCALLTDGSVRCWGRNDYGQLGDGGTNQDSSTPVSVSGMTDAIQVAGGCALHSGGSVSCWGFNNVGQLGDGTHTSSNVPVTVSGVTTAKSIAVGGAACAILGAGKVVCWGDNTVGELGDGTVTSSSVPVSVVGFE